MIPHPEATEASCPKCRVGLEVYPVRFDYSLGYLSGHYRSACLCLPPSPEERREDEKKLEAYLDDFHRAGGTIGYGSQG